MTSALTKAQELALCEFARTADLAHVLDRASVLFRPVVATATTLPGYLVDAMFAAGDQWLATLAGNVTALEEDPVLRRRVAATGRAVLAPIVLVPAKSATARWTLPDRRALLAAADPLTDGGWVDGPGGDVAGSLRRSTDSGLLRSLVVSPFPPLVLRALEAAPELTRAEQLRALLSLHSYGVSDELAKALRKAAVRRRLRPDVGEVAAEATTRRGGLARLRSAVAAAESTAGAVDELYRDPGRAAEILSLRTELDWTALRSAHEADPFPAAAADALADRPDCPEEMLNALSQRAAPAPNARPTKRRAVRGLPGDSPPRPAGQPGPDRFAEEMLYRIRPAGQVLDLAHAGGRPGSAVEDPPTLAGWSAFRHRLADLVAATIGADPHAWRELRRRLPRARGTVAEVLAEAAAGAAEPTDPAADGGPWPGAADCPPPGVVPKREATRMAFVAVLDAAPYDVQRALLPYLDERTAYDLLAYGEWRPEWAAFAAPDGPERERRLLARRPSLPADRIQALAELDDPAVNAGLFYQRLATWDQRYALLAGTPLGSATGRLPLDPAFRASLLDVTGTAGVWGRAGARTTLKKNRLAPLVGCGDPELVAHFFDNIPLRSRSLQLRLLLGVWEHSGRDAAGKLMPRWFQESVRTFVGDLLAADDPDHALSRLREAVYTEVSPGNLVRRLRTSGRDLDWLLAEGYRWDWQVMVDEHRRKALPAEVLAELCTLPDCPDDLRRTLPPTAARASQRLAELYPAPKPEPRTAARTPGRPGAARAARPTSKREILGALGPHWAPSPAGAAPKPPAPRAAAGDVGARTAWSTITPARSALSGLDGYPADVRIDIQTLVSRHLDDAPDAWVLAIRLLPEFPGSLPELLATASAAVR
ncbi:hypothetical protein GCM10022225_12270 [Plantactinospora mayteni]|uniref:Secreted protein n=1 Tax=Plantactinospora mayteni TaxID=566021 RepID=A0ABQ4EH25_9ACTN|nr:hypothetical protein [Plantactinospora mayteni]GIG94020.1 hypothetical protein Pma05_05930 [Plantactinospora mayteni]